MFIEAEREKNSPELRRSAMSRNEQGISLLRSFRLFVFLSL